MQVTPMVDDWANERKEKRKKEKETAAKGEAMSEELKLKLKLQERDYWHGDGNGIRFRRRSRGDEYRTNSKAGRESKLSVCQVSAFESNFLKRIDDVVWSWPLATTT